MYRIAFLLILSIEGLSIHAQHRLGIKLSGGISKISQEAMPGDFSSKYKFSPSGHAGVFYSFSFLKYHSIGTDVLFNQMEGRIRYTVVINRSYGTTEQYIDKSTVHISCLSVPVYYGLTFKKVSVKIGFQGNYFLIDNAVTESIMR